MTTTNSLRLMGFTTEPYHFHFHRHLTAEEMDDHRRYTPIISEVRNRLRLFKLLHTNFLEWEGYIMSLRQGKQDMEPVMEELDRLLLNFLTCGYTIREHFRVSFRRRFRKDDARLLEYDTMVNALCSKCWPFAFMLDFRGFVQHRGLGVGRALITDKNTGVEVSICCSAPTLLREPYKWGNCKLHESHGELNLVELVREAHNAFMTDYADFVIRTFLPEIVPATDFYAKLTREVEAIDQRFRMAFIQNPEIRQSGEKQTTQLQFEVVPNNVLRELGIVVTPVSTAKP